MKKAMRIISMVSIALSMTSVIAVLVSTITGNVISVDAADETVKNYEYYCQLSNDEVLEEYKTIHPEFDNDSLELLRYSINYYILRPYEAELTVFANKETIDFTDDIYTYFGFPSRTGTQMTAGYSMTDNLGTDEIEDHFEVLFYMDIMTTPVTIIGNDEQGRVIPVKKPNDVDEYEVMRRELTVINSPIVKEHDGQTVFNWRKNTSGTAGIAGDANIDGKVTVSDAVAVLQFIANNEKYPLGTIGKRLADIDGEEGITGGDAIAIQMIDAGISDI